MSGGRKRIFIQSVFPAPYRTGVFKGLNEAYDIFVVFERSHDKNRSVNWFIKNFGFNGILLDNEENIKKYHNELKLLHTYDAVLAYDFLSKSSMKLMLRCMKEKIPYFVNCDGAFINHHPLKKMIKKFFFSRAKGCFASGVYAEAYFLAFGAKKNKIYRHPFSSLYQEDILSEPIVYEEKMKIRETLGLPIDKKIVISIGQFAHRKGFDILLKAWDMINLDNVELIIIGGGEEIQAYRTFIIENNLKNVTIVDFQPKSIITDYYKAADLFVLPTREDIWGLVINEAMANGLPIITTNRCVAGLELIDNGINGYIVPVEDEVALADKIKMILINEKLREEMGRHNLEKIKDYTIENIAKAHIEVLNSIV